MNSRQTIQVTIPGDAILQRARAHSGGGEQNSRQSPSVVRVNCLYTPENKRPGTGRRLGGADPRHEYREERVGVYTVPLSSNNEYSDHVCTPPSVNVRQPRPERARNRQNLPTSVGRRHQFDVHFFSLYPTTTPKSTYLRKVALTFSVQPTLRPFLPFPGEKQDPK